MTHLQALSLIVALGFWLLAAIIIVLFIMIARLRKDLDEVIDWARSVGVYIDRKEKVRQGPRMIIPKDKEVDNNGH